ncbi:hypothetical protein RLOatenuis_5700 [Rickettsiales bacterium]|nr:hypothetical protein RLOatenuis_5700 [Rickettsiales bacterium]
MLIYSGLSKFLGTLLRCFSNAIYDTIDHDGAEYAGYLAFLFLLSLFPFLVFFAAIIGQIAQLLDDNKLWEDFIEFILSYSIPKDVIDGLKPRITEIISKPPQGVLTLSAAGALWTASSVVEGMRTVLNRAYRVHTPPAYIFRRLLSIVQILFITVAMVLAILSLTVVPIFVDMLSKYFDVKPLLDLIYIRYLFSVAILFFCAFWLYLTLPNVKQKWRKVMPGTILLVLLWSSTAEALSYYLRSFNQLSIIYGSLAGIIVSMLFFYLISICFIFCAEFNHNLAKAFSANGP